MKNIPKSTIMYTPLNMINIAELWQPNKKPL